MRTRFMLPCLLAAALLLGACDEKPARQAAPAVAVVDVTRALRDSDAGKAGMKFLEDIQKDMQEEISRLQETLKAKPDDEKTQQQMQAVFMAAQQRMQMEQQNVISRLNDMFQRVLEAQRASSGHTVIVPAESVALAYAREADITDAVIAAMNKEKMDFAPVAPKPESPAAEQPAPAAKPAAPAAGDVKEKAPAAAEAPAAQPATGK